jgi:diguanylate cyclase (GGDEF)-like protein
MSLDVPTLTFAGGFVALSSSIFLLFYWWQDRKAWSALWWAAGNCGLGVGIFLLSLHDTLAYYVTNIIGPLILDIAAGLAFAAARILNRGSVNPYLLVSCLATWMGMQVVAGMFWTEQMTAALGVAASAACYASAALELHQGRNEQLRGRKPIIVVLTLHAAALVMTALQYSLEIDYSLLPSIDLLGAIHFVSIIYSTGTALLVPMMLKERSEQKYKQAALTDPLTGLANRRGFMDRAQRMCDRMAQDARPVALLVFDLDRFKRINDTFGHAMGDRILRVFADILLKAQRPTDITARIGGEEFVAMLPNAGEQAAIAIANRIREAFQSEALFIDGQRIVATVSVGIAACAGRPSDAVDMLAKADSALYRAKNDGRNRVFLAEAESSGAIPCNLVLASGNLVPGNVIRIA